LHQIKTIDKVTKRIGEMTQSGELSNEDLVQIIELCGIYLNIRTIPNYAKENGLTYNGVKKTRNIVNVFGQKFVIDNG